MASLPMPVNGYQFFVVTQRSVAVFAEIKFHRYSDRTTSQHGLATLERQFEIEQSNLMQRLV
jgi:hypothetical protein